MRAILVAAYFLASTIVALASPPPHDSRNASDRSAGKDWRRTWKLGPDRYAFEGMSGGCHYSGTITPSGYHYDRSC